MELREFNCKCCTAPLDIGEAAGRTVRCKYCGTVFMLAREEEGKVVDLLRSAELLLDTCKFGEAYTAYEKAAELDGEEPEAYFGMALATFRVQYLKDEVNNRLQPICHEISEKVFSDDKNFRKALELATDEQRREYRKRGREIDEVKEEFFELQRKGLDYDCFLCVKVTDGDRKTADYDRANEIYYYLKDEGFKPFFSEREMKGRTGSDYEALILYALYKSECMLIVCSNEEYLQTKWVKNEYTRFMAMIANEEKERDAVTFVFEGKPVEKLPNGKKVQGIDLSRPDAYARIDDFVQKHTPEARARREEEERAKSREIAELKEQLAQMKQERATAAAPMGNFSPAQFLAMMREAEEAERKKKEAEERRRAEEERARREEEERLAAERRAAEKAARKRREAENAKRDFLSQLSIEEGALKLYSGKGGDIVIPNGVVAIGAPVSPGEPRKKQAFEDCSGLTSIQIPDGVKTIGPYAFRNCIRLKNVVIPDGVTSIGNSAFEGCSELESISIPDSVTAIGESAFENCSALTKISLPKQITTIKFRTFCDCAALEEITIPSGVVTIDSLAFFGCTKLSALTISDGVRAIGSGAFMHCTGLTKLLLPDSVTLIGKNAFVNCSRLTSISLPKNMTAIAENVFEGCSKLAEVTLPDGMKTIGNNAFEGCGRLKTVALPYSVSSIGERAFFHCGGLTEITVPDGAEAIGALAFGACPSLAKVTIPKRFKGGFTNTGLKDLFGESYKNIKFTFTE